MIKDGTVYCDQCHASIPKAGGVAYLNGIVCEECHNLLQTSIRKRSPSSLVGAIHFLLYLPVGISLLMLVISATCGPVAERMMRPALNVLLISLGLWLIAAVAYELQRISGQYF